MPLTSEQDWLKTLQCLPAFVPSELPIVLIAPHPDDETLAAGGLLADLLARGAHIRVVAVTDGENAYPDAAGLGAVRRAEQMTALQKLGLPREQVTRFGLPDSDVASHENALAEMLTDLIDRPSQILAPWHGDFHPDHEACARAAGRAAEHTGSSLISYFFWTWHRGTPALLQGLPLLQYRLTGQTQLLKAEALECHRSQLAWANGEPILPERLLAPARRTFEVFSIA